jgi:hypothetical protein
MVGHTALLRGNVVPLDPPSSGGQGPPLAGDDKGRGPSQAGAVRRPGHVATSAPAAISTQARASAGVGSA